MVRVIDWIRATRLAQVTTLAVLSAAAAIGSSGAARATPVQITQQQPGTSAAALFDGNGYAPAVITSGWSRQASESTSSTRLGRFSVIRGPFTCPSSRRR